MYLINTETLCLEEFQSEEGLKYAILSHRWEEGEVTYQDMELGRAQSKPGFTKIEKCCEEAKRNGLHYAWVDTCCIDKKSSAELSEAINSMYRWYKKAVVCYAFLSDASDSSSELETLSSFRDSLWFTRGWTLQELLAPQNVLFYDQSWRCFGNRDFLSKDISYVTNIKWPVLRGDRAVSECSIAERMSWAAYRETTRIEDRAYSLLGIFEVNMPLLYGEGEKAFIRLQEEIIRHSNDHSIFAWRLPYPKRDGKYGLLATSPGAFVDAGCIRPDSNKRDQSPFAMTNSGLSITLKLTPWAADTYLAVLKCVKMRSGKGSVGLGIFLRKLSHDGQYTRTSHHGRSTLSLGIQLLLELRSARSVTVHVKQNLPPIRYPAVIPGFYIDTLWHRIYGYRILIPELRHLMKRAPHSLVELPSGNNWDPEKLIMAMKECGTGTVGIVNLECLDIDLSKIKLGFDFDYNPLLFIIEKAASTSLAFDTCSSKLITNVSAYNDSGRILEAQDGVWAIQGDRVDGIRAQILTGSRLKKNARGPVHIRVQRVLFEGALIWELEMAGLVIGGGDDAVKSDIVVV